MKVKALIYCTKAKPYLIKVDDNEFDITNDSYDNRILWDELPTLNGKIVCECEVDTEEIECVRADFNDFIEYHYITKHLQEKELIKRSGVDFPKLQNYLRLNNGYALHISNIKVFDKPRELYDCLIHPKIKPKYYGCEHLSKAPQNMMYVELDDIKYILISIRPEWLCKILNGEKTIEVRKKVLKEMIKNE